MIFLNMAEWLRPGFCTIFHVTVFATSDEWFEASFLLLQTQPTFFAKSRWEKNLSYFCLLLPQGQFKLSNIRRSPMRCRAGSTPFFSSCWKGSHFGGLAMPLTTWSGLDVTKKEYRSSSLQVCAKASKSKNSPMGICIDKSSRAWFNGWWQLTPQRLRRYSWRSQSCTVGRASKEGVSEATAAKWRFLQAVREAMITQLISDTPKPF